MEDRKQATIKMLQFYLEKVSNDQIDPKVILIYERGSASFCGLTYDEKSTILQRELDVCKMLKKAHMDSF